MPRPFSRPVAGKLAQAIEGFKHYATTDTYQTHLQEREERKRFFQHELPRRLDQLAEPDVEQIVGLLWAHRMWGNKAYVAQRLVEENGLERIVQGLRLLYASKDDPEEAYARFLNTIRHWGPASVTEILAYIYPDRCGLWNKQARTALEWLGLNDRVPTKKYRLSKVEYRRFNHLLQSLADELRRSGFNDVDLLVVDFLLYYIASNLVPGEERWKPSVQETMDFDHDEVRDVIANIGSILGFDTQTEVPIARGARVDVVWRARIGNLGMVTYVFEVHRSGSIDSLILNLQKSLNAPSVQKVIAVSDAVQLQRIEQECAGLPEQFRRALRLWDVREVLQAASALQQAMVSIEKLGLMEERRP